MSRLPQLERDLVRAAGRRRRRFAAWAPRVLRPALALALIVGVVVGIGMAAGAGDPEREVAADRVERVPEATFALSEKLTKAAPPEDGPRLEPLQQFLAEVARVRDQTPYPPGRPDDFDWKGVPDDPRDMGSITGQPEIQMIMEYRARCQWLRYWLDARNVEDPGAVADAERIIRDLAAWPTLRRQLPGDAAVKAVTDGDEVRVRKDVRINCNASPDPAARYDTSPESGHRYGVKPRTLTRRGSQYAVVGYTLARDGDESLCLDLVFVGDGTASGCFSATERAQGTAGGMKAQHAVGATTQEVDAVEVRYRDGEEEATTPAILIRADDRDALEPLDLAPFTFYVAELPSRSKPLEATATLRGEVVWRAAFP